MLKPMTKQGMGTRKPIHRPFMEKMAPADIQRRAVSQATQPEKREKKKEGGGGKKKKDLRFP